MERLSIPGVGSPLRPLLLATSILSLPTVAMAQPVDGLYVGAGAGANIMSDQTLKSLTVPATLLPATGGVIPLNGQRLDGHIKMNGGFSGEMSVGYGFGELTSFGGPRVEVEGNYMSNGFEGVGLGGGNFNTGLFSASGQEQKYGVFGNVLWDFTFGAPYIYPYIGAGVGGQWSQWNARFNNRLGFGAGIPQFSGVAVNNTQSSFAYQAIVGASIPVPSVPGLSVTADFRFINPTGQRNYAGHARGADRAGNYIPALPAVVGTDDNFNYSFLFGVRYAFNAAPPPPPPAPVVAPAPAPARSYLVFFDWDRADLTDRARQIVAEAAQNSTRVQYTRIDVNGYTDTSGSARYNQGLSVRRAQAVAAELVKDGVPRQAITIQGFGETHLLVPTGPNVREPQNRRVEIIIG